VAEKRLCVFAASRLLVTLFNGVARNTQQCIDFVYRRKRQAFGS